MKESLSVPPIRPMRDHVIVRRVETKKPLSEVVWTPPSDDPEPVEAVVLVVGPGNRSKTGERKPVPLSVGDRIMIGPMAGTLFEYNGEQLNCIRDLDVLGVIQ